MERLERSGPWTSATRTPLSASACWYRRAPERPSPSTSTTCCAGWRSRAAKEAETDPNRLNLLTLHSTKGLEFSRVYVVGVENQVLPGWRAIQEDRDEEIQEARRLLYVGMTRAKARLVLTHADQRAGYRAQGHLLSPRRAWCSRIPGIPPALRCLGHQ